MERNKEEGTKKLVAVIREAREKMGWSQERMALELGINRSSYGHIETGTHKLSADILVKACDLMGIEIRMVKREQQLN